MSHERSGAARPVTDSKEKTFNRPDEDPLFTSMRTATSAIDETEDSQLVLLSGKGDREALRGDGSGHQESRGRAGEALWPRGQGKVLRAGNK